MVTKYTHRKCRVDTTYEIQPNGSYWERVTLSVDPASELALAMDEPAGKVVGERATVAKLTPRFRR
jgi:hypothetical protein